VELELGAFAGRIRPWPQWRRSSISCERGRRLHPLAAGEGLPRGAAALLAHPGAHLAPVPNAEGSAGYTVARGMEIRAARRCRAPTQHRPHRRAHEALRTTFADHDGYPVQVVTSAGADRAAADRRGERGCGRRAAARRSGRRIGSRAGPLLSLLLVRLGEEEHRLLRINHHIISDGRSWDIFFELMAFYEADRRGSRHRSRRSPCNTRTSRRGSETRSAPMRRAGETTSPGGERTWRARPRGPHSPSLAEIPTSERRSRTGSPGGASAGCLGCPGGAASGSGSHLLHGAAGGLLGFARTHDQHR
jgi:hypothetical protein